MTFENQKKVRGYYSNPIYSIMMGLLAILSFYIGLYIVSDFDILFIIMFSILFIIQIIFLITSIRNNSKIIFILISVAICGINLLILYAIVILFLIYTT